VTKQEIGRLCFKLLSLYTFIQAISYTSAASFGFASVKAAGIDTPPRALIFFPMLLLFCLSVYFWFAADVLAERIFPKNAASKNSSEITPAILKKIAFILAGILVLNSAVPTIHNLISAYLSSLQPFAPRYIFYLAESVLRVVVGLWLILGSSKTRESVNNA
jgi:hypothetical protein